MVFENEVFQVKWDTAGARGGLTVIRKEPHRSFPIPVEIRIMPDGCNMDIIAASGSKLEVVSNRSRPGVTVKSGT